MFDSTHVPNPYSSPHVSPFDERYRNSGERLIILEKQYWLYRRFSFLGQLRHCIEYQGWGMGFESVFVDGSLAARERGSWWTFAPQLDFYIPDPAGRLRGRIEVKTSWLLFLGAFRLIVENEVLYSEGDA